MALPGRAATALRPSSPGTHGSGAPASGPASGNGSIILLLSLFLLMLVFFIMLNAQSVHQIARVKAVMASLEHSFFIDPRLRDGNDPVASRTGTVFAVERLTGMGELFATTVAVAKVTTVAPGKLMEVRLAADELFTPGTAQLRPDKAGLLDRVADSLRRELPGERVELDFLLALAPEAPSQPPGPIERAAALARDLVGRGAPAERVTIGIERGTPGAARFLFSVRDLDEPVGVPRGLGVAG